MVLHPRQAMGKMTRLHLNAIVPLMALLTACAATPRREPSPPSRRRTHTAPTAGRPTPSVSAAARRSPTPMLDEQSIGETGELVPLPEERDTTQTVGPDVLAAVPPPAAEATDTTAPEPESLLTRIGPNTPPNVTAALRLTEDARQQMQQGRYDLALDRLERAVAIDPANAYGYYFLAQLHFRNKQYDQALAFANRATIAARKDRVWLARAYSLQGAVFEEVGRYADARKAYQEAVDADPNNLAARSGMARLNPAE
jgi:predicted negative regulator of RcsB-dependent stress response